MRPFVATLVALTLGLAACGGDDDGHQDKRASTPPQTPAQPSLPQQHGPNGHLTNDEYRAIIRQYRSFNGVLSKLNGASPSRHTRREIEALCAAVEKPATVLVALVAQDCRNAAASADNVNELERTSQKCQDGPKAKAPACAARAYSAFAAGVRKTLTNALRINEELSSRGIGGVCQRSIGISPTAIAELRTEIQAASAAAGALRAGDGDTFNSAVALLQQALLAQSNAGDPLPGIIHSCPHRAAKAAPKPKSKKTPPHRAPPKPRLRQPGDNINI